MAGLIAALFGGRARPPDPNPLPGVGGYRLPRGPVGAGGYPGSTNLTRTFGGNDPRTVGLRADTNTGWDNGLSGTPQTRQAAYRGEVGGGDVTRTGSRPGPRQTSTVATRQPIIAARMQETPGTLFGGPVMRTGPGALTAGGNPLGAAQQAGGHSQRDTETPPISRQPIIGVGAPGSANVRNQVAQRYKAVPGGTGTYQSASRPDQAPVNRGGQQTDGSVRPDQVSSPVTVQRRFVYPGGGNTTWSVLREMPYGGRGDGARGAQLSGQRYFATGQGDQFVSQRAGQYGVERLRGSGRKRPVSFTQPAPWASNFYDTTETVGTVDTPGTPTQAPDLVYVSPSSGRATNGTGRRG